MQEVTEQIKVKGTFSGHESFQCRHLWLKKGYDYISKGKSFNDEDAVVSLGIGKNMVSSLKHWMRCFDITDSNDKVTDFAIKLLDNEGWDPYIEDEATLWLLHYKLVKKGQATTYNFIFNELRREKIEFTKENFLAFVKRKAEQNKILPISEKTLTDDFGVMGKMYLRSNAQAKDKEDTFSGLLTELDLIKTFGKRGEEFFIIENTNKDEIPDPVLLYSILEMENIGLSVSLNAIENDFNSPGAIFAINKTGLINKIESIGNTNSWVVFNDHAGIKEIQFKRKPKSSFDVLEKYYNGK
jgi:hypothetical protein